MSGVSVSAMTSIIPELADYTTLVVTIFSFATILFNYFLNKKDIAKRTAEEARMREQVQIVLKEIDGPGMVYFPAKIRRAHLTRAEVQGRLSIQSGRYTIPYLNSKEFLQNVDDLYMSKCEDNTQLIIPCDSDEIRRFKKTDLEKLGFVVRGLEDKPASDDRRANPGEKIGILIVDAVHRDAGPIRSRVENWLWQRPQFSERKDDVLIAEAEFTRSLKAASMDEMSRKLHQAIHKLQTQGVAQYHVFIRGPVILAAMTGGMLYNTRPTYFYHLGDHDYENWGSIYRQSSS